MNSVEHIAVAVQDDFLAQQTYAQPIAALAELIWNSVDVELKSGCPPHLRSRCSSS